MPPRSVGAPPTSPPSPHRPQSPPLQWRPSSNRRGIRRDMPLPSTRRGAWPTQAGHAPQVIIGTPRKGPRLREHRQRLSFLHDLSGKRRAGGSREFDVEIRADQALVTVNQHRLEVARARLQELALPGELLHQHLDALAESGEVLVAGDRTDQLYE